MGNSWPLAGAPAMAPQPRPPPAHRAGDLRASGHAPPPSRGQTGSTPPSWSPSRSTPSCRGTASPGAGAQAVAELLHSHLPGGNVGAQGPVYICYDCYDTGFQEAPLEEAL